MIEQNSRLTSSGIDTSSHSLAHSLKNPLQILKTNSQHTQYEHVMSDQEEKDLQTFCHFFELLLKKTPQIIPFLTEAATSTEDVIADISYLIRTFMPQSTSVQALGVTTGENIFQGAIAAFKAAIRFKKALKREDREGMIEAGVDTLRGTFQSVAGAAYLGYRGTMIPSDIFNINVTAQTTNRLGQAAFVFGNIGNAGLGAFYLLIGAWGAYRAFKDIQFISKQRQHADTDEKQLQFFTRKACISTREKLAQLQQNPEQMQAFKKELASLALTQLSRKAMKWQKEQKKEDPTFPTLTEQEIEAGFYALLTSVPVEALTKMRDTYLSALQLKETDLTLLELIGLRITENRRQQKKEDQFSRIFSRDSLETLKKANRLGLNERLHSLDPLVKQAALQECQKIDKALSFEGKKQLAIHLLVVAIGVMGIVVTVLGFLTLPPAGAIALLVITAILCVSMGLLDGYLMITGWNQAEPGRHDKKFLIGIAIVLLTAFVVSVIVTSVFALPVTPLLWTAAIVAISLGLCGFSYYQVDKKEKKWKIDHPQLIDFQKSLAKTGIMGEPQKTQFKKLPKADRVAIRKKYGDLSDKLPFKNEKYQSLDKHFDFGHEYLTRYIEGKEKEEFELLCSAMKKTLKQFWTKWGVSQEEIDKRRALLLQELWERIRQKNAQALQEKLIAVQRDETLYNQLKYNIWYVVKRQESPSDLLSILTS